MSNFLSHQAHRILKQFIHVKSLDGDICSSLIKEELQKDKPSMIARFGSVEIKAVLYPKMPYLIRIAMKKWAITDMELLAGFYPATKANLQKFSDLMIEDMKLLDILGSWRMEERFFQKYYPLAIKVKLNTLEPYLQKDPWTEVLEGKKILVIHPFSETIEYQYLNNRKLLFEDKRVLPEFKTLETIKAVQTIAGNNRGIFKDWFEALDYMKGEIDKKDFDIAIIGCGAYGFPLAAHVKRLGKKAIHLGGATQLLFGIKGKRWIERDDFKSIINNYFVSPKDQDRPENSRTVEGGSYW